MYTKQNNGDCLLTDIYFADGQRQTIVYDGHGRKISVKYSQTASSVVAGNLPDDGSYTVTSTRDYIGPHVFENGELVYSGFDGGYFEPGSGTRYYITDWQVNVARVVGRDGKVLQSTTYYPYGEPTIEPAGQPWLFSGKERIHAGGRNVYDFGARHLIATTGTWSTIDPLADSFHQFSPFTFCAGDPINHIDRDGRLVIFINGMHNGFEGGCSKYWENLDQKIMNLTGDFNAQYIDGSLGGALNLIFSPFFTKNISGHNRYIAGYINGYINASKFLGSLLDDETIKIITHSMGAMYGKGFTMGLKRYAKENEVDINELIEFELDLAPFEPYLQRATLGIKTITISHKGDWLAGSFPIDGAYNNVTRQGHKISLYEHSVNSFTEDEIKRIILKSTNKEK